MLTPFTIISLLTLRISNETVLTPTEQCAAPDSPHAALHFFKNLLPATPISFFATFTSHRCKRSSSDEEPARFYQLNKRFREHQVFYLYRLSLFTGLTAVFCNSSLFTGQICTLLNLSALSENEYFSRIQNGS